MQILENYFWIFQKLFDNHRSWKKSLTLSSNSWNVFFSLISSLIKADANKKCLNVRDGDLKETLDDKIESFTWNPLKLVVNASFESFKKHSCIFSFLKCVVFLRKLSEKINHNCVSLTCDQRKKDDDVLLKALHTIVVLKIFHSKQLLFWVFFLFRKRDRLTLFPLCRIFPKTIRVSHREA